MIRLEKVLKTSLQGVLKMSWRCLEDVFVRRLENVLERRLEDVLKTFLQDVLRMSWRRLEDVFARRLEDVLKMSWKRLDDVLKTYDQDEYIGLDQDVFKLSSEDACIRWTYSSWSRCLLKTKTKNVFKPSSKRLHHQDECLLGCSLVTEMLGIIKYVTLYILWNKNLF